MNRLHAGELGALAIFVCVFCTGCPGAQERICPERVLSAEELVALHNARALPIEQLWARADTEVWWREDGRERHYRLPSGNLVLRRDPADPLATPAFILRGTELGSEVFRMGIDPASGVYYFWITPPGEGGSGWSGRLANLDRPNEIGFDPTQLLSVLGVLPWSSDPGAPPYIASTAETTPCVYELHFLAPRPDGRGLFVQREVWIDRHEGPHQPIRTRLFRADGEPVMVARTYPGQQPGQRGYFAPVQTAAAEADWPLMPERIDVSWPQAGVRLRLRLSQMTTTRPVPDSTYQFSPPPGLELRDLDAPPAPPLASAEMSEDR